MDYFLTNPMMQPKLTLGNYVTSQGFPVPQIFPSFSAALASGEPFIARSEHPQEHTGVSGLLNSFPITSETLEAARSYGGDDPEGDVLQRALQKKLCGGSDRELELNLANIRAKQIDLFCRYQGTSKEVFLRDVSFSYWKLLGGYNQTMVADNAISGRYHVFTVSAEDSNNKNYSIIDNSNVVVSIGAGIDTETFLKSAATFVQYYESVRRLGEFDPLHCPIIECQWLNGMHYFLQYHRTRDMEPAKFEISRAPEENEVEALLVRGATPPEGLVVNTAFYYPKGQGLLEHEEASFDAWPNFIFSELMVRRRDVQFSHRRDIESFAGDACGIHLPKSLLFNPPVSVVVNFSPFVDWGDMMMRTRDTGVPLRLPIRVVSDGRRALIKVLQGRGAL